MVPRSLQSDSPPRALLLLLALIGLTIIVVVVVITRQHSTNRAGQPQATATATTTPAISPTATPNLSVTPEAPCHITAGLPDPICTPGATDPAVTQETIGSTICISGYSKTVRPSTSYTNRVKRERMQAYGLLGDITQYELDHLIPLSLGGAPAALANLWPEAEDGPEGATAKDRVENYLHDAVCAGRLSLVTAQEMIARDWLAVYRQLL